MGVVLLVLAGTVGVLIGMVGVGGVLLAPGLVTIGGMDPYIAAATSTWAFLFTGTVGTISYAWRGLVPWSMLAPLAAGIIPAAVLGAVASAVIPANAALLAMAALALLVGTYQLAFTSRQPTGIRLGAPRLGAPRLIAIGTVVGFGSAVTGTGGPVLLVPVLLLLGVDPVKSVGVSQAAQLPVVVAGSVAYLQAGATDVGTGTVLGLMAAGGTIAGALLARRLPARRLRLVVACACIVAGGLLVVRVLGAS